LAKAEWPIVNSSVMANSGHMTLHRNGLRTTAVFAALVAMLFAAIVTQPASAHRSGCHRWHSCPSDLYTYSWHGLWCTSHSKDKIRVVYEGLTYWCHR
jgi:hypothetical protein